MFSSTIKAMLLLTAIAVSSVFSVGCATEPRRTTEKIPAMLEGKWSVTKILPTNTISCWDEKQAQSLIGSKLSYQPDGFSFNGVAIKNRGATQLTLREQQFIEDNSGSGSYVDFAALGISTAYVERIEIKHDEVTIKGITDQGTTSVPGDEVMIKDPNRLIIANCGVWFEAQRQP